MTSVPITCEIPTPTSTNVTRRSRPILSFARISRLGERLTETRYVCVFEVFIDIMRAVSPCNFVL